MTVDVTVRGPHEVGIRTESLTYRPNGIDSDRTLRVVVWYPTAATTGDRGSYLGLGEAIFDAPILEDGEFPVLLYSHGTTSFAECAYDLMEYFASHGFVVASADHTGDTTADRIRHVPQRCLYSALRTSVHFSTGFTHAPPTTRSVVDSTTTSLSLGTVTVAGMSLLRSVPITAMT